MFNVEIFRARYLTFRFRICIWFGSSVWFLSCDDDDVRMCVVSSRCWKSWTLYIIDGFFKSIVICPTCSQFLLDTLFVLFNSHDHRIHSLEGGLFHPYFFVGFSVVSFYIA